MASYSFYPALSETNIVWNDGTQPFEPDTDTIPDTPFASAPAAARAWITVHLPIVIENSRFQLELKQAPKNSFTMGKQDLQRHISSTSPAPSKKLVIRLIQDDTLGAARTLYKQDPTSKIAILNFANNTTPGGGALNGRTAQEENLCHHTSLYPSLKRNFYPLHDDEIIYSHDILVAKLCSPARPVEGLLLHESDQYLVDVISCAAVREPGITIGPDGLPTYSDQQEKDLMQFKLETILSVACVQNVQKLVLGAFGCGVFRNPPHAVAKLIRAVLLGSLPPTKSKSAVAVPPAPAPTPATPRPRRGKAAILAASNPPPPQANQTEAEQAPPPPMPFSHFLLDEVVISILDTEIANNQPIWNAFVDVFRDVADIILPQGAIIGDVEEIAHNVFPPPTSVPVPISISPGVVGGQGRVQSQGAGLGPGATGADSTIWNDGLSSLFEGTILSIEGDDTSLATPGSRNRNTNTNANVVGGGNEGGDGDGSVNEPRSIPRPKAKARPMVGKKTTAK